MKLHSWFVYLLLVIQQNERSVIMDIKYLDNWKEFKRRFSNGIK